ncbi:MAG TPA: MFS transporter [Thermoanaerobaculia bacterium]|nr:MFS transporter [Thermoanaerobaculia bacterium]
MSEPAPGRRAFSIVFLTVLLDLTGFAMILPQIPFYALELNATPAQVGMLFSSYSLAQFLFAPLLGRFSDRVGRRPVLLAALCGSAASHLLFAFAGSFAMLIVARSLAGVAASFSLAQAYAADISSSQDRSRAMGLMGAAFGIAFVVGPLLGWGLGELEPRVVPLTAAALSAAGFLVALLRLPESLPAEVRERAAEARTGPSGLSRVRRDGLLGGLLLLFFLVMFCFSIFESTLALYCQRRFALGRAETSGLFALVGIVLVVVQGGLLGRLVKRFGEKRLILAGIGLMGAGVAVLPAAPTLALFAACLCLLAAGSGLHNPSTLGLLSRLTGEGGQGGILGLSRSSAALARTLGPALGTWMFGAAGAPWPFWTAGALLLAALLGAWTVLSRVGRVALATPS